MITESILSAKVLGDNVLITTSTGKKIWVGREDYTQSASKVTFSEKKAGDKYKRKDGTEGIVKQDGFMFDGLDKIKEGVSLESKFKLAAQYGVQVSLD